MLWCSWECSDNSAMKRTDVLHKPPANDAIYYAGCRSSPDVIGYAVWLYHRFR